MYPLFGLSSFGKGFPWVYTLFMDWKGVIEFPVCSVAYLLGWRTSGDIQVYVLPVILIWTWCFQLLAVLVKELKKCAQLRRQWEASIKKWYRILCKGDWMSVNIDYYLGLPFIGSKWGRSWLLRGIKWVNLHFDWQTCIMNPFSTVHLLSHNASGFSHMHVQLCINIKWK